jgi:hypothetical protein
MIQFNLLPDVKQQYIRAKRLKHSVILISLLAAAASLFVFVMLFLTVYVFQKTHLKNLDNDIQASTKTLKDTPNLTKILTIQNQLHNLPALHEQKPAASRLAGYFSQLTPTQVSIGELEVNFDEKTMVIKGGAEDLLSINKFVDSIKFTTLVEAGNEQKDRKPFSDVVLKEFTRNEDETTYTLNLSFDPVIFDNTKTVSLTVPKITSTRSETEKPTDLFKALPEEKKQ